MKSKSNQIHNNISSNSNSKNIDSIKDLSPGKALNEFTLAYILPSDSYHKENFEKELALYETKKKSEQNFDQNYSSIKYKSKKNFYNDDEPNYESVSDLNKERIRLFGNKFIETNYSKCKLIIDNKEQNLVEYYFINNRIEKKFFEIKLKIKQKITNFEGMFKNCKNLLTCPNIGNLDTSEAVTFKSFFEGCENLQILPKFLKWDTKNVEDMSSMFEGCKSLLYLPDLSKFDMSKVKDISNMFTNCSHIKFLPKINKWNTSKIKDMKNLFKGCSKLAFIPDISIWDTSKVTNMKSFFYGA